jgi:hypothetical protein
MTRANDFQSFTEFYLVENIFLGTSKIGKIAESYLNPISITKTTPLHQIPWNLFENSDLDSSYFLKNLRLLCKEVKILQQIFYTVTTYNRSIRREGYCLSY